MVDMQYILDVTNWPSSVKTTSNIQTVVANELTAQGILSVLVTVTDLGNNLMKIVITNVTVIPINLFERTLVTLNTQIQG